MATTKQATPLQRLMGRIQDLPACPLCEREECECWTPLSDMEKANADLLAACEALVDESYGEDSEGLRYARAAIAKAGHNPGHAIGRANMAAVTSPVTWTVECLSSAYGGRIPWDRAQVAQESANQHTIIREYNRLNRWYHPQQNAWSGHVRIVGNDGWVYTVEGGYDGERARLVRYVHLDDLA